MKWTDLSLSALRYFVDAIELGSLTKAAEKNHVSRPAISQAIRRIEEVIGYDLISHAKNRLELTEHGRSFFQRAASNLLFFNQTFTEPAEISNRLSLACSATLAEFLILPALSKLKLASSRHVHIKIGTTDKVRRFVSEGEAELGLIINDEKTYGFESLKIARGQFILRSKSGHLVNPLITTEVRPEVVHLMKVLKKNRQASGHHMHMESWSICRKAADTLGGTCLIPDLIPAPSLKPVRDLKYDYGYEIRAIYKNKNFLSDSEIALLNLLQS